MALTDDFVSLRPVTDAAQLLTLDWLTNRSDS
jgi:hypothetical protein